MSNIIEQTKHGGDVLFIGAGLGTTIAFWMDKVVNPLLTAGVLILTMVWTYYRIKDLRDKQKDKEKGS